MWLVFEKDAETYCVGFETSPETNHVRLITARADEVQNSLHDDWNAWEMTQGADDKFFLSYPFFRERICTHALKHPEGVFYVCFDNKSTTDAKDVYISSSAEYIAKNFAFPARLQHSLP